MNCDNKYIFILISFALIILIKYFIIYFNNNLFSNLNLKIFLNFLIMIRNRDFFVSKKQQINNKFIMILNIKFDIFSLIFLIIMKCFLIDFFYKILITLCVLIISKRLRYKFF